MTFNPETFRELAGKITKGPIAESDKATAQYFAYCFTHAQEIAALAEENARLTWFGTQKNLELHYHSPTYCDDDDQATEWRVTKVGGPINDREWDIVGRGETPAAAILSARAALERKPHD